jgi:hypothetical protein
MYNIVTRKASSYDGAFLVTIRVLFMGYETGLLQMNDAKGNR